MNEELGSLGDDRFRFFCDVIDLGAQGDSKFPLLSLDLIIREDVRDINAAGDKRLGL